MEYQKELQTEEVTDESFRNGIGKMRVLVNGKNFFNEAYRRYPIHQLLLINGEWKYQSFCSIKYSNFPELIEQILNPEDGVEEKDFSSIEENFALVLNCDETCEAEKYWEYICFFVRYTPKEKTIEICDREKHCWNSMNFCRSQQIFQKNDRTGEKQWIHQNLQDE